MRAPPVSLHPSGQLTFENQGFRDTSTYASRTASRAASDYWGDSSSIDAHSNHTASVSVHHNGTVHYQQPTHPQQPGRSGMSETEYSRVRSRSEAGVLDNYSTNSGVTDSTMAMRRELDYSDAITLPQRRTEEKVAPLINRPPATTRSQQLLETNFHALTTGYLAASNEQFFMGSRSKSTPLETDM